MCGRFAFFSAHEAVLRLFDLPPGTPAIEPRWNIAPTQYVPVVRTDHEGARRLAMLYWGLVPHWAKEKAIGARMINARAETLAEKPSFRTAYRRRRCLVIASGYYEWQALPAGKQPWFIRRAGGEPFAMAGLWESWIEKEGEPPLESCAIVTTEAAGRLAQLHHRVPVILPPEACAPWLDPRLTDTAPLAPLLVAPAEGVMEPVPVSRRVNNARNEGPELVEPIALP
ncbi:MAG: SOS response-associated peptidase [Steroidobacteraceae bacterium]